MLMYMFDEQNRDSLNNTNDSFINNGNRPDYSSQDQQNAGTTVSVGMLFVYAFAFYLILIIFSLLLTALIRPPKYDRRLYMFMTIFGNVGFMGFPLVQSVYGTEGLFYAAIVNSVFNIFVYTFGVVLMGGAGNAENMPLTERMRTIPWKKLLLTPARITSSVNGTPKESCTKAN